MSEGESNNTKDPAALAQEIIKENEEVLKQIREEIGSIDQAVKGNEEIYKLMKISKEDLKSKGVAREELEEYQQKAFDVVVKEYNARYSAIAGQAGIQKKSPKTMRRRKGLRI